VSFGGLVALRLAAERPDLVSRLVLLATAHRFSAEGVSRVRAQMAHLQSGNVDAMVRPFLTLCRRPWLNLLLRASFQFRRQAFRAGLNDPAFATALLQAALDESGALAARLGDIRAETLVVAGDRDQFFDVEAMREMALLMPSARLALLEKETHMVPLERARDVRAAIVDFLRGSDQRVQIGLCPGAGRGGFRQITQHHEVVEDETGADAATDERVGAGAACRLPGTRRHHAQGLGTGVGLEGADERGLDLCELEVADKQLERRALVVMPGLVREHAVPPAHLAGSEQEVDGRQRRTRRPAIVWRHGRRRSMHFAVVAALRVRSQPEAFDEVCCARAVHRSRPHEKPGVDQ
jgi:hypothetical protein